MYPPHVRAGILELVDQGLNDCEIARRTGISRTTVRDMRRGKTRYVKTTLMETCPRCWRHARPMRFSPDDYAELLGLYLGDGSISQSPRTARLRIVLDAKYPGIVEDTRELLERCFPRNDVHVGKGSTGDCLSVSVYCSHLVCLFPQHGPGLKHSRRILLEPWQQGMVDSAPWAFLRGCIRSDGCAFINRTGPYEYLSYHFSNSSEDIIRLFVEVSDGLQLRPRVNQDGRRGLWHVRINRRESVARMVQYVGLKT
jgi:hypothetical protein